MGADEILLAKVKAANDAIKETMMLFTGSVFTFIYRPHEQGFADYAVVKMRLKDGKVEEIEEVSDPLAAFEARAHMETKLAYQLEKMRRSYPPEYRHV